ncbi:MAG: hypothetical protein ACTSQI_17725 [Candidatus Helarchaeota archaeon]
MVLIGFGMLGFAAQIDFLAVFFYYSGYILLYLSLVPIGLTTVYYAGSKCRKVPTFKRRCDTDSSRHRESQRCKQFCGV